MNWNRAKLPSLHHRKEGWPSDQQNAAKHPLIARPGWFSDETKRKTTPAASASVAARHFLMTRPPLLAAMQGGESRTIAIHSHLLCVRVHSAVLLIIRINSNTIAAIAGSTYLEFTVTARTQILFSLWSAGYREKLSYP